MATLDGVEIFIEQEDEQHSVNATEYAVEEGEPFTDHIAKRPSSFSISGYIISDDWETDKEKLIGIMNAGKIIKYVGKMTASNVVILDIKGTHGAAIANGMTLDISLRRVRITTTAWQKSPPKEKTDQKPPTSGGTKKTVPAKPATPPEKYHVVAKGQTYWYMSGKYGTPIAQLRSWNGWADTKIPIGAKARVQ